MKISIWQQFSSNHSGGFWVVGRFENLELAEAAFKQIRTMLFEIDEWHRKHKDETAKARQSGDLTLFPPEEKFKQQFAVEWNYPIDWTNWANYYLENHPSYKGIDAQKSSQYLIDKAVRILGQNVIVSSPDQTWMTIQPFEGILSRLGAKTIGYDMEMEIPEGFGFHTVLTFTAPDKDMADRIENELKQYLAGELADPENPPPWHDEESNFESVFGKSLVKREYVEVLKENWTRRYELHNYPEPSPYGKAMVANKLVLREKSVEMKRDGLAFTWSRLWFHNDELAASALIAWLEVLGCVAIDYVYRMD